MYIVARVYIFRKLRKTLAFATNFCRCFRAGIRITSYVIALPDSAPRPKKVMKQNLYLALHGIALLRLCIPISPHLYCISGEAFNSSRRVSVILWFWLSASCSNGVNGLNVLVKKLRVRLRLVARHVGENLRQAHHEGVIWLTMLLATRPCGYVVWGPWNGVPDLQPPSTASKCLSAY